MIMVYKGKLISEPTKDSDVINNVANSALNVPKLIPVKGINFFDKKEPTLKHKPIGRCECGVCESIRSRRKTSIRIAKEDYEDLIEANDAYQKTIEEKDNLINYAYNKIGNLELEINTLKNKIEEIKNQKIDELKGNDPISEYLANELKSLRIKYNDIEGRYINNCMKNTIEELKKEEPKEIKKEQKVKIENVELVSDDVKNILEDYYNKLKNLLDNSKYNYEETEILKDGSIGIAIYYDVENIKNNPDIVKFDIKSSHGYYGILVMYDENTDTFKTRTGFTLDNENIDYYITLPYEIQELFIN